MKRSSITAITMCAIYLAVLAAQESDRRGQALEDLQDGDIDRINLFMFKGCPQEDPQGVAVFEAVRDVQLDAWGISRLASAFVWGGVYPDCAYAPLDMWLADAFRRIHEAGNSGAAWMLADRIRMQSVITDRPSTAQIPTGSRKET